MISSTDYWVTESSHQHGEEGAKRNLDRQLTAAGAPECNYSQPLRLRPADNITVREKKLCVKTRRLLQRVQVWSRERGGHWKSIHILTEQMFLIGNNLLIFEHDDLVLHKSASYLLIFRIIELAELWAALFRYSLRSLVIVFSKSDWCTIWSIISSMCFLPLAFVWTVGLIEVRIMWDKKLLLLEWHFESMNAITFVLGTVNKL